MMTSRPRTRIPSRPRVTKIVLLGLESIPLTSRFIDFTLGSNFVHLSRLCQSKMSFHQALDLIFELDEAARARIDMVIKNLDLEPKVDAMMRDFLEVLRSFPMERIEQGIMHAYVYYSGNERNKRVFQNTSKTEDELAGCIKNNVGDMLKCLKVNIPSLISSTLGGFENIEVHYIRWSCKLGGQALFAMLFVCSFVEKLIVIVAMATKFEIEKFNGNNFSLWKLKMKAILTKDKCLAAIGERPAEVTDNSKWAEIDENAIANLHLALADRFLSSIEEKKTAKDI
ncbi:hypothetical protein Tco_0616102 [Tanacetum coccineum]